MTELSADAFREVGPDDAIPDGFVVPFYLATANCGSPSRTPATVFTRSTISAPAPATRARSPAACSPGRRSCANATARNSTSPRGLWSAVRPPGRSTCTKCRWPTAPSASGRDHVPVPSETGPGPGPGSPRYDRHCSTARTSSVARTRAIHLTERSSRRGHETGGRGRSRSPTWTGLRTSTRGLGWRLDADFPFDNGFRVVQFTPPGSGVDPVRHQHHVGRAGLSGGPVPGRLRHRRRAKRTRRARGEVSEVFHAATPGAQFQPAGAPGQVSGPAPDHASYGSFATFSDPDGNGWLLQEVRRAARPGRHTPPRSPRRAIWRRDAARVGRPRGARKAHRQGGRELARLVRPIHGRGAGREELPT